MVFCFFFPPFINLSDFQHDEKLQMFCLIGIWQNRFTYQTNLKQERKENGQNRDQDRKRKKRLYNVHPKTAVTINKSSKSSS